jgi:hypothetical protein
MKVLLITDCAARGEYLEAGKVYELDSDVATELIKLGRAADAPVKPAARKVKGNGAE